MGSDFFQGGITQSGSDGSYTYAVKPGFESQPVVYVSFWNALRFANWLNNGQGSSDTETGAYTLLGDPDPWTVTRNPGAITFLPSENEWYKAAYYSPGGTYFDYPTGRNKHPRCVAPGLHTGNSANCSWAVDWAVVGFVYTDVGSYTDSPSPYGTFDQGGNAWEWNEQIVIGQGRGLRGGYAGSYARDLAASVLNYKYPSEEHSYIGFRVASLVPEPGQGLLVLTGGLVLAATRRQRRA